MERKTYEGALERFKRALMEDEKSEATVEKYVRDAEAFVGYLDGKDIDRGIV